MWARVWVRLWVRGRVRVRVSVRPVSCVLNWSSINLILIVSCRG